ncbi:MAG TPA: fused MFS/spermidine synthase, partial [Burkholderiales bacterium]|nr:fused MFS/spermidine synthase [Burkholderiales bacterium]
TRHADAADPYFLYVASNFGSMLALIGYPLVIEPALGLARQSLVWTCGYVVLALLIAACAANAWYYRDATSAAAQPALPGESSSVSWRERAMWMLLAFAPSSLMLGVTQHITSEIAAVPLLWLVPLALYVMTFMNAFARRPPLKLEWAARLQPLLVILLALTWVLNIYLSVFLLHLASFLVIALMCHGELARRRPPAAHLTEFYIWIALGGALGGAFNALAAPLLFDSILEYPLVIALACMLRPAIRPEQSRLNWADFALPAALAASFALLVHFGVHPLRQSGVIVVLYLEAVGIALYLMHPRPVRFGLAVAAVLLATPHLHIADEVLARHRSFFGVHTVLKDKEGGFHVLLHGITVHGAQHLDAARRYEPTTFYHRDGPLGQLFSALGGDGRFRHIAMIGLGTGSAACYREAGREFTFFEIDPLVVQLARDPRWFSFLAGCAPGAQVMTGDGRLSLAGRPDRSYDLIIVDTFSSDSIPVHMITREAVALYFRKLSERGVLMLHITNQYLDLTPILVRIASDMGLATMVPGPRMSLGSEERYTILESHWMAIARNPADLEALASQEGWEKPAARGPDRPWTDDYSNILQALK